MSYLGSWKVDDFLTFCCNTHDPDTGVATDADSVPTYRVYEDETATPILTGSTALLDAANTAGFYSERIQLTAANGFEKGKCYTVYITATVDSDTGTMHHNFQVEAEVDASVDTALSDIRLNELMTGVLSAQPTAGSMFADLTEDDPGAVGTQRFNANALEEAPTTPTAATIADAVWNELSTDHVSVGKAGQQLWTDLDAALADTDELQADLVDGGRLDLLIDTIKAKTDNLPADPADDSDIDSQLTTITTHLTDVKGTGFVKDTDSLVDLGHIGADGDTLETLSDQLDDVTTLGAGAVTFTYTLTSDTDSSAITGADVWVTSDEAGNNVIASGETDSNGQVTFYLDAGDVFVWRAKSGWDFTNPDAEEIA
jgi:hypothetical protein